MVDLDTSCSFWRSDCSASSRNNLILLLFLHLKESFVNFRSHQSKSLLNVCAVLCRDFKKWDIVILRQFLTFIKRNLSVFFKITLVSNKELVYIFSRKPIDFLHPLSDIVKRVLVGHIVHNDYPMSSSVIRRSQCSKPFLSSCVPLNSH